MEIDLILNWLVTNYPKMGLILSGLGALVVAGTTYVALTPSIEDDNWIKALEEKKVLGMPVGKILTALRAFSPISKK